jgi:hypothetical protein
MGIYLTKGLRQYSSAFKWVITNDSRLSLLSLLYTPIYTILHCFPPTVNPLMIIPSNRQIILPHNNNNIALTILQGCDWTRSHIAGTGKYIQLKQYCGNPSRQLWALSTANSGDGPRVSTWGIPTQPPWGLCRNENSQLLLKDDSSAL